MIIPIEMKKREPPDYLAFFPEHLRTTPYALLLAAFLTQLADKLKWVEFHVCQGGIVVRLNHHGKGWYSPWIHQISTNDADIIAINSGKLAELMAKITMAIEENNRANVVNRLEGRNINY